MSTESWSLDEARECRKDDPDRALEIANHYVAANPTDARGYFSRYITWDRLGEYQKALADCTRALQLEPNCRKYLSRGEARRRLGDHSGAVSDFDMARALDPNKWLTSFGPHLRADSLARVGRLQDALADCELIRDDHWMPSHGGLPGGNKQQFIAEIKRRAAAAK